MINSTSPVKGYVTTGAAPHPRSQQLDSDWMKTMNFQTVLPKSEIDNVPLPKPEKLCLEDFTAEGSLWVSIKMHRIWTEANWAICYQGALWAITGHSEPDFLLKWDAEYRGASSCECGNKGKSLPLENETFKLRHNTKQRNARGSLVWGRPWRRFRNCAMTPVEAWHHQNRKRACGRASHPQGPTFTPGKATWEMTCPGPAAKPSQGPDLLELSGHQPGPPGCAPHPQGRAFQGDASGHRALRAARLLESQRWISIWHPATVGLLRSDRPGEFVHFGAGKLGASSSSDSPRGL